MSVDPPPELDDLSVVPSQPPKGALGVIFLIVLCDLLGFSVIIPLLPFWALKFHATDFEIGLLFSVYSACQLVATPILGLVSDRFGRRPVLIFSQIGSVIGFLLLGVATYGTWAGPTLGLILVYVSRVLDGFSGGNISTAQAYISDVTSAADRAKGMGLLGAAFGIGFTIGPALGGILGHFDVSYPAFAAAACSGIAAIQTYLRLPESRVHTESEAEAWLHPSRFLPIFRNGPLVQMLLIFFFSMMAFVMMESTFAVYLYDLLGFGALQVGLLFGMAGIVIVIVQGGLIGRLTKRFGEWPLVIIGPLLVTTAMYLLSGLPFLPVVGFLVIIVIINASGRSLQTPTLSALISHTSDRAQQGTVFGLFHMLGSLSRAVGPVIAMAIYVTADRKHPHLVAPYLLAGSMTLLIAVWSIILFARHRTPRVDLAAPAQA